MDMTFIEELSLNNWPALSTVLYDGWVLRFAEGYTKRANSVSPIYGGKRDLAPKIDACERIYRENGLRPVFKLTASAPDGLDRLLSDRGYEQVDMTSVQTLELIRLREPMPAECRIETHPSDSWVADFCRLTGTSAHHQAIMTRMLGKIRTGTGFITFHAEGKAVACGFGVIERGYIGLYDIVTDPAYRNRGFAEQMILHLLHWGKKEGARFGYLAVVLNNAPALRLYAKLGYREAYRYWYRCASR
ncbi:GNAT family N-acetyltransferase [Paenibacillus methanolicus]|uniref:Acetyltransferase (GNAT) family protein n=1 Tax=Paenibacillus methanolicus TaxID=582686 RepID=A0A5S5C7M8_9BACL|nr:GNAT family N-acetyltransferase [Paenibacillus methanolicus]TYP73993.1 acetyltransferase (GNAT) family protein [Paenibacillus methanolicus]